MRLYIAGPRTGVKNYNREAFEDAASHLRALGHWVLSPTALDAPEDGMTGDSDGTPLPPRVYRRGLTSCLKAMLAADLDAVAVLRGWEGSHGARAEVALARALGWDVYRLQIIGTDSVPELVELPAPPQPRRHPSSDRFHEILRGLAELHDLKSQDYGSDADPFANVRASGEWGIPEWVGAMVRATDKVRRLQAFAQKGSLANESAEDAFRDMAVYAVIALVLYEEQSAAEADTRET